MEPPPAASGGDSNKFNISSTALASWLQERLLDERTLLEHRHERLCDALLLQLGGNEDMQQERLFNSAVPIVPCTPEVTELWSPAEAAEDGRHIRLEAAEEATCDPETKLEAVIPSRNDSDFKSWTSPTLAFQKNSSSSQSSQVKFKPKVLKVDGRFARIVLGTSFEACFGFLIFANSVVMVVEAQHKGILLEREIGYTDANSATGPVQGWLQADTSFLVLDLIFGCAFTLEVILKLAVLKHRYAFSRWNIFDSAVVMFWLLSLVESIGVFSNLLGPLVFRVCRLARLFRLIRLAKVMARTTSLLDTMVLMVISVRASIAVLFWGIVLLFAATTISALVLQSLLSDFMEHAPDVYMPDGDMTTRHAVYRLFGTYSRSMVTMFEITLANWVPPCRILVDYVSEYFALFIVLYKCIVGFAVLKVITGVFLHETFRTASLDDDIMIQNRRKMRTKFKNKMLAFFSEADNGGDGSDGVVSQDEFVEMVGDDRVNTWLEAMDLRIRDVGAERVFAYLAGPDGVLTRDELCVGMSRLRGPAQGLDVLTLLEIASPEIKMPRSVDTRRLLPGLSRLPTPQAQGWARSDPGGRPTWAASPVGSPNSSSCSV